MRMLLTILAIFAVADRAATAPVPKEILKKFPEYYPLNPGTVWEYASGELRLTVEVSDYEFTNGVKVGTLSTLVDGRKLSSERIRVDASGVYRTHINTIQINNPVLILKFGIKDETEWSTKFKLGQAAGDMTMKLAGVESIKVPAGKYDAVRVEGTGKLGNCKTDITSYFVESVGIAKLEYSIEGNKTELQLTKFTPGKEKD